MKLAACVVLYNPDLAQLKKNILSYYKEIDYLFLIDNSERNTDFTSINLSVDIIKNGGNFGIASALNIAAEKATTLGYEWLLTMDQDSNFEQINDFKILKDQLDKENGKVGIYSPIHIDTTLQTRPVKNDILEAIDIVMTSGNLLNLKAWADVGKFEDKLFIDGVDYDYCLKLKLSNYKCFVVHNAFLEHPVGDVKNYKFLSSSFQITQHNHLRVYYMTRNAIYLIKKYRKTFPSHSKSLFKRQFVNFIKIILFETKRFKKARFFLLGLKDGLRNKYGKCVYQ